MTTQDIGLRIKALRESLNLTQTEFAKKAEIDRSHLASIETGRQKASLNVLMCLVTTLSANTNWLLTGKGKMFLNDKEPIPQNATPPPEIDPKILATAKMMESLDPEQWAKIKSLVEDEMRLAEMKKRVERLEKLEKERGKYG